MLRLILLVVLGFSLSNFFRAQSADELIKKEWPKTYSEFGNDADAIPLNFIFVLDISDKTFGNDIKRVVKDFLQPVKDGDYFNVILLGSSDKTANLTECAIVNSSKKSSIVRQIENQEFGTKGSDGVKMTGLVIDAMNCAGSSVATPIVFVFSDFVHYNNGWSVPGDQFWDPLKKRYDKMLDSRANNQENELGSYVYFIELPNVDRKKQYKDKLLNIFTNANTVTCNDPALLDDKFNNIKANIKKNLIRKIISQRVEKEISNVSLINSPDGIRLNGNDTLVYSKISLDSESQSTVSKILNSELLFSFFPPNDVEIEVSGTLVAEKYKNEVSDLKDIPLSNQKITLKPGDSLIPWWLTDIIVTILLISIFRIIWTLFPPARLRGNIEFFTPSSPTQILDCSGRRKKFSNNDVKMLKSDFSIEIKATKKFFGGKCLILIPTNGDLLLISRKEKKTASRGKKTIAKTRSQWSVDGIEIKMPDVK
jgi:hypothetical protein